MSEWLAESIDDISDPYDKARFEAGYAVIKDPPKASDPKPFYAPFTPTDPATCTCVNPFSDCPTHG